MSFSGTISLPALDETSTPITPNLRLKVALSYRGFRRLRLTPQ